MEAVTQERIAIAREFGLMHTTSAAAACRREDLPYWAACALLEKESMGRNVYGRSDGEGAALSGFPEEVNRDNFAVFRWLVIDKGQQSNGVGPCQITYAGGKQLDGSRGGGYFQEMAEQGLRPWVPYDNMRFGFRLMAQHKRNYGTWRAAGTAYNGDLDYGVDFVKKCNEWRERLNISGEEVR